MLKTKCKCCQNFMSLVIDGRSTTITTTSPTSWYYLYAPNATSPRWIYHTSGSTRFIGYSTAKNDSCRDPSGDLTGKADAYFACVEDLVNSFGSGENSETVGWSNIPMSGRMQEIPRNIYHQPSTWGFFRYDREFADITDVDQAVFGKVIFRPVPHSKMIPSSVFGYAIEMLFQNTKIWEEPVGSTTSRINMAGLPLITQNLNTLVVGATGLSSTGTEITLLFDRVILARIKESTNLDWQFRIDRDKIHCQRINQSATSISLTLEEVVGNPVVTEVI